ncbi:MAG: serine/threonine-protein phosphatase, partial [Mogibacterium sp.]|nr:serine/threonine-protein phosphatase [Mogibacterium sp.]
ECVNAGHEYPAVMSGDGQYKLLKDKHGLPLGCMEGMTYSSYKLKLEVGDCIYVYTDGIAEAINTSEEQFGTDRMLDVLNQNKDAKMTEVLSAVKTAVDEFAGEAEQFDDQTMVGFRYTGLPEKTKTEA